MKNKTLSLAVSAIVGAAYAVLTMAFAPISYGAVQLRVSEVLCILPYFMPSTVWGLFLGCAVSNLLTGNVFDVVFGSLATLLAALATARIGRSRRSFLNSLAAASMPVIVNALMIGGVITQAYNGLGIFDNPTAFWLNAFQIAVGEATVLFLIGLPLMRCLPKKKFFADFVRKVTEKGA